MHVGWAAVFAPPEDGSGVPGFAELRAHVAARLDRAPRYTQRLAEVPLGVNAPLWVDDPEFGVGRHLRHTVSPDLGAVVDAVMSEPLPRDRPLWQMYVADRLADGRLGLVGKAHHCMVDGLAAVQLGTLLLDTEPQRPPFALPDPDIDAADPPEPGELLAGGVLDLLRDQAQIAQTSLRAFGSLGAWRALPGTTARAARTLAHAVLPPAPRTLLNGPSSPRRHLATLTRPLEDLRTVRHRYEVTVNDVLLAACAGGLRSFLLERGEDAPRLKTMVPVSVRPQGAESELGNRISFMFVELPCDEPDPVVRLMHVHRDTAARKRDGEPADAGAALQAIGYAPRRFQRAVTQLVSSPRMFNLVVSNIPGPRIPLYLRGCRLEAAWPVVPLAEQHALSIGMTTVEELACFGFYSDAEALPDADVLAGHVDCALDELLALAR